MTTFTPITYQFSTYLSNHVVHSSNGIGPSLSSGLTSEEISRVLDSYSITQIKIPRTKPILCWGFD